MTKGDFTYRTPAKDSDEAVALCNQCYSETFKTEKFTTAFSNIVIENVEFKDGLWIVTGTFDTEKTVRVVDK